MIGLSLSLCVRDILDGKVKEEDVDKIVANTCACNPERWGRLMSSYCQSYWRKHPVDSAEGVVGRLRAAGKIIQPRVDNRYYWRAQPSAGVWVADEAELQAVVHGSWDVGEAPRNDARRRYNDCRLRHSFL